MPDNFIDLTVTSPPYDNLRVYNGFEWDFEALAKELFRVTKVGGVVVWVVGDSCVNGGETLNSFKQALFFQSLGFSCYDTMIWLKPSPQSPTEGRYYDVFEYMFVFSKGKPKTINFLVDRNNFSAGNVSGKETRSCKEDRGKAKGIRVIAEKSRRFNVWEINRGESNSSHVAVFPEKLAADHIHTWSNQSDLVYDPFMGSGTTAKKCIQMKRNFIGSEISQEYVDLANKRIAPYKTIQTLF
jgi:site-specific DNA-methyltransferase (adenine-specific)